ncbi:hypothetical protein C365_05253, partial [Cryptococcus neoformans Bt85]
MAIQLYTQPNKSPLSAAKFFSSISNLHKYLPSSTFVFNLPHKHLYLYHNASVCNLITKHLQSHLQALSGNPYGRTNDVIEATSMGQKTTLFSEADNQPLSSSSGADDVAAPTLPSVPHSDDSVSSDISIPRSSPPAGQFMSLSDDAYPPPLSGQETSQGGLERESMDINDGQGDDDLPAIMMDESLLETGFEGDGYGGVICDRLNHQLSRWPTKVSESLIPPYSCQQPNPYQDEPIFRTESTARSMPVLATVLAVFSIFLMAFVGLPQRLGDMVKAVIQVILEFAIAEDQQALRWRIRDKRDLSPGERGKMYRILDLSVETSSSR